MTKEETATFVTDARKRLGLTMKELANAIGIKGFCAVSRWENGHHAMRAKHKLAIQRLLESSDAPSRPCVLCGHINTQREG